MKFRDPMAHWDPLLKWLLISLFVLTAFGYVLVGLIVLKGQKKFFWQEEESQYFNRVVAEEPVPGHALVAESLDDLRASVDRDLASRTRTS